MTLEIGCRGYIDTKNKSVIKKILSKFKIKQQTNILSKISKISLLGSYTIYNAREEMQWTNGAYISP